MVWKRLPNSISAVVEITIPIKDQHAVNDKFEVAVSYLK